MKWFKVILKSGSSFDVYCRAYNLVIENGVILKCTFEGTELDAPYVVPTEIAAIIPTVA